MTKRVAVAGASGYAGGELVRLLHSHPEFEVVTVTAHSQAGQKLGEVHPHLSFLDLTLQDTTAETLSGHDVVFLSLPHGTSGALGDAIDAHVIVDCGADRRLTSESDWAEYYGGAFSSPWVYGMPELGDQRTALATATSIAVPGCNATAVTLGFAPLVAAGLIDTTDLVSVLSVGTSGAGKGSPVEARAHEHGGSAFAYGVGDLRAEHVHFGEGDTTGVFHRTRVEFGHEQLVVLGERVGDTELTFEVFEALLGDVEDVVVVEELGERLTNVDSQRNRSAIARHERVVGRHVRACDNRGDVRRDSGSLREHPRLARPVVDRLRSGGVGDDNPVGGGFDGEVEGRLEVGLFEHRVNATGIGDFELRVKVRLAVDGVDESVEPFTSVRVEHVGDDFDDIVVGEVVELNAHSVGCARGVDCDSVHRDRVNRFGDGVEERR